MRKPLTEVEREFISEMSYDDDGTSCLYRHFDPDFRQADIARLLRLGWFERRVDGDYRTYRWTPAGRAALAEQEKGDA